MSTQTNISFDEWVENARPDPKNTEALIVIQGFIGKSSEDGHIRVYEDETLNNFVEIPQDSIVHSESFSKDISSLGGSKLWFKASAAITYGDPKAETRPKASFLEGDIMQQHATAAAFGPPAPPTLANCLSRFVCPTRRVCGSVFHYTGLADCGPTWDRAKMQKSIQGCFVNQQQGALAQQFSTVPACQTTVTFNHTPSICLTCPPTKTLAYSVCLDCPPQNSVHFQRTCIQAICTIINPNETIVQVTPVPRTLVRAVCQPTGNQYPTCRNSICLENCPTFNPHVYTCANNCTLHCPTIQDAGCSVWNCPNIPLVAGTANPGYYGAFNPYETPTGL